MKQFWPALAIGITLTGSAFAQDKPPFPILKNHGASAEAFVPPDWQVIASALGDLNRDGRPDKVLVLQRRTEPNTQDYNILAVLLAQRNGSYDLGAQTHNLIPRWNQTGEENSSRDAISSIRQNVLKLAVNYEGADGASSDVYRFRFQDSHFLLIGYGYTGTHRGTLSISINYLTGQTHCQDSADDDARLNCNNLNLRFQPKPLLSLEQTRGDWTFQNPQFCLAGIKRDCP
jgi:hypothetical protein